MKIKDNISRPRLEVTEKLEDAVCAHQEWSEAIEAMKKLKFEKMLSAEQTFQGDKRVTREAQGVARGHWGP